MARSLELSIRIKADNQAALNQIVTAVNNINSAADKSGAGLKNFSSGVSSIGASATQAAGSISTLTEAADSFDKGLTKVLLRAGLLATAVHEGIALFKEAAIETAKYAAQTEMLQVATNQLAKVNGLNGGAVRGLIEDIKSLGITTQEAESTVQRMIVAQLDLRKATTLARLAQDTAVIAGTNSSDTLEKIILGVTTGQTRLLHNLGLQVSAQQTWLNASREMGRPLTEIEKRQALLNKVLEEGTKLTGTYEAAMGTAGKQLTSLTRFVLEAKNAVGQQLLPIFKLFVEGATETAKWVQRNSELVADLIKGITALGVAYVGFKTIQVGFKGIEILSAVTVDGWRKAIPVIADLRTGISSLIVSLSRIGVARGAQMALFDADVAVSAGAAFRGAGVLIAEAFTTVRVAIAGALTLMGPWGIAVGTIITLFGAAAYAASRYKSELKEAFKFDDEGADRFKKALTESIVLMEEGAVKAGSYRDAVRNAVTAAGNKNAEVIGGKVVKADASNADFQAFIKRVTGGTLDDLQNTANGGKVRDLSKPRDVVQSLIDKGDFGVQVGGENTKQRAQLELQALQQQFLREQRDYQQTVKDGDDGVAEKIAWQKKLAQAIKDVAALERQQSVDGLTGIEKVNAERQANIEKLGLTKELIEQINTIFDKEVRQERGFSAERAAGLQKGSIGEVERSDAPGGGTELQFQNSAQAKLFLTGIRENFLKAIEKENKANATEFSNFQDARASLMFKKIDADKTAAHIDENNNALNAIYGAEDARSQVNLDQLRGNTDRQIGEVRTLGGRGYEADTENQVASIRRAALMKEHELALANIAERERRELVGATSEADRDAAHYHAVAELIKANGDLQQSLDQLEYDRRQRILELRKQEVEKFRSAVGQVFDAATANGGGMSALVGSFGRALGRTVAQNAGEELFRTLRDKIKVALPGQTNSNGTLNTFGRLLQGTPFGIDPAELATKQNTTSTDANTLALGQLDQSIAGVVAGTGASGVAGVNIPGLAKVASDLNGITGQILNGGGSDGGEPTLYDPSGEAIDTSQLGNGDMSETLPPDVGAMADKSQAKTGGLFSAGNIAKGAGAAAGAYGVYSGIRQGGSRGVTTAIGSAAGVAAIFDPEPISKAILAGVAVASGLVGSLLPDPKVKRQKELDTLLQNNQFVQPNGLGFTIDSATGHEVGYTSKGMPRVMNTVPYSQTYQQPTGFADDGTIRTQPQRQIQSVVLNINALDSKSVLDRSGDITDAVLKGIRNDHSLMKVIRGNTLA